jgi:DNA-binding transcriptional ArsR family regulator
LQRKIVEYLCACETTVPVKEISKRLFSSQQTISSQLQNLREKGYVESNQRGRESLYEVSEPLMRICVEVKENQRNKPLRLLVDFLRVWYDDDELVSRMGLPECAASAKLYLSTALERNRSEGSLRKKLFLKELMQSLSESLDPDELQKVATNCEALDEIQVLATKSILEGRSEEAFTLMNEEIDHAIDPKDKVLLSINLASMFQTFGDAEREEEVYANLYEMSGITFYVVAAFFSAAYCDWRNGKWNEGFIKMEKGLKKASEETLTCISGAQFMLQTIFNSGLSPDVRYDRIDRMAGLYQKYVALPQLGDGLVKHLGKVLRAGEPFPSSDNLRQWLAAWEQTAGDLDEFRLPLRLLRVGIDYIIAGGKDSGVLLTLTSAEREILKQAFGISEAS